MHEIKKVEQLNLLLHEMEQIVFKGALEKITDYPVISLQTRLDQSVTKIRARKISRIIYDRSEDTLGKFISVFSALHSCDSSVALILKGAKAHTDIYIATNKISSDAGFGGSEAMETLDAAIKGNFPGVDLCNNLYADEIELLLQPIQSTCFNAIASVAGVPSLKSDNADSFSQGLEKIIDGMKGRDYISVIHASPVSRSELERVENAYQDIYTALSTFEQRQLSLSENESRAVGIAVTEGITKTLSQSIGETQTKTTGENSSTSSSNSDSTSHTTNIGGAISAGAGMAGAGIGFLYGGPVGAALGASIGGGIGALAGSLAGSNTTSTSTSFSGTSGTADSNSTGTTKTISTSEAASNTRSDSNTNTFGTGKTLQITEKNRRVTALLTSIDSQLNRIDECKNYGMWSWSAYFVGSTELDARLGADLYSGILRGESTGLERNSIAVWKRHEDEQNFQALQKYIAQLKHPVFQTPKSFATKEISHISLISTKEMAVAMSLPQKSLPGIPVFDTVTFGRSITRFDHHAIGDKLCIGKLSNFGMVDENCNVEIDIKSLTAHTFITGSTGAGKSNAIYSILDMLHSQKKIPFLIIEPAKGEYKQIFGGRNDVHVFGTNPKLTSLLRLNPFSFPDNIHVMEHIDRLIEILNAVWPMYAAMPAILKEAVELTYERSGWDLINSKSKYHTTVFPDFYDLLEVLPEIINQSDYSQEIKGNYAGALVTRIRSLTNGYFKIIFQKNELSPVQLFDEPCIVDLSRVGSSETKSLLMGLLFLKLQEYRMSEVKGANSELRHITVLEEAHNLLRRTSSIPSADSSNLQGKSVEIISNAIAEMRTYGEGFIISDQAPGLLDPSVIRNTNTKIILRLPDFEDRNLVGKAASLNGEQIDELSRLKTGCAAVYQNDWLEPVLCQFNQFNSLKIKPFTYTPDSVRLVDVRKQSLTEFIKTLVAISFNSDGEVINKNAFPLLWNVYFPNVHEQNIATKTELCQVISSIINLPKILDKVPKDNNIDVWFQSLVSEIGRNLERQMLNTQEQIELMQIVLNAIAIEAPHNRTAFDIKIEGIKELRGDLLWY